MNQPFETETLEHFGVSVKIEYFHDWGADAPWDKSDSHGDIETVNISPWRGHNISKAPGQVILHADYRQGTAWLYDFAGAMKKAKSEGWSCDKCTPDMTPGQKAYSAVCADMDFLGAYLREDWRYVGIGCTVLDDEGEETEKRDSCWGFESFNDYHKEAGQEMAKQLAETFAESALQTVVRDCLENKESAFWADRDVMTKG